MVKGNRVYLLFVVILAVFFVLGVIAPAQAEASTAEERALEELREAIEEIPERDKITEDDRPAIEEAVRLRDQAMAEHGITEYDICVLAAKLAAAEKTIGVPELPPTGGFASLVPVGLLSIIGGAAILISRKHLH